MLENTSKWVVITSLEIESHQSTHSQPDHSTPAPILEGAFVWSFDEAGRALASLTEGKALGEIEAFYPLAYEFVETRGGTRTSNGSVVELKIGLLADTSGPISSYFDAFERCCPHRDGGPQRHPRRQLQLRACDGQHRLRLDNRGIIGPGVLIDAGVMAVVGAFCGGASMSANAVLSGAGITMVSPTSTISALSDWDDYPHFFGSYRAMASRSRSGDHLQRPRSEPGYRVGLAGVRPGCKLPGIRLPF